MKINFYHHDDECQCSVRAELEIWTIGYFAEKNISELASQILPEVGCVNQPVVVAFNAELEPIGIALLPLVTSRKQPTFSTREMIQSLMEKSEAARFYVFVKRNYDQSSFPTIPEFRLGLELEEAFSESFIDLIITDDSFITFRALKADRWLPDLYVSCYQNPESLYYQSIARMYEKLETDLKWANMEMREMEEQSISDLSRELSIGKTLARKLRGVSIRNGSILRSVGSVSAWKSMKLSGEHVTSRELYALEAAIRGIPIGELTAEVKKDLKSKLR